MECPIRFSAKHVSLGAGGRFCHLPNSRTNSRSEPRTKLQSKALNEAILQHTLNCIGKVKYRVKPRLNITIAGFRIIGRQDQTAKGSEPKPRKYTFKLFRKVRTRGALFLPRYARDVGSNYPRRVVAGSASTHLAEVGSWRVARYTNARHQKWITVFCAIYYNNVVSK